MKNKKVFLFLIMFFSSFVILPALYSQISPAGSQLQDNSVIQPKGSTSYSVQWLKNPNMTSPIQPTWDWSSDGDFSDIQARDGGDQANVTVIGNKGAYITNVTTPTNSSWTAVRNLDINVTPDFYNIDTEGISVSHFWDAQDTAERFQQTTSIRWQQQITMTVNMSDYTITSASLEAIVNATVTASPIKGGIDVLNDSGAGSEVHTGDYVKFYVQISDVAGNQVYEIAQYRTIELGWDATAIGIYSYMTDTPMTGIPQDVLITLLTAVLQSNHRTFNVTLGMDLYSERNQQTDQDTYDSLRIKSFNLTISYEKKIDRGTLATWNQKGNQLPKVNESAQRLDVDAARLYFKMRSDRNWTIDSPNSELRVLVNNQTLLETISLTKASRTFKDVKMGGFDVTSYITKNVNISVGIQVYLADNFLLTQNITISIDEVYLWINYTISDLLKIPPTLNVLSNTSIPFINYWTQLTVSCESNYGEVSRLWYQNPFTHANITLDSNFAGLRTFNLDFMNESAGSYLFKFWANSTFGTTYDDIIVVWVIPQSPLINLAVNSSNPFTNQWARFTVSCQSGSANVSSLWYYNPFDFTNHTLGTNFEGFQILNLSFTSATGGAKTFKFWANSTLGADAYRTLDVVWVVPMGSLLTIYSNSTNPHTGHSIQITSSCTSGSAMVELWWYRNPFDLQNHTLDSAFIGSRIQILNFTSAIGGAYTFKFWANSTIGAPAYYEFTAVWVEPTPPVLSVQVNTTSPYTGEWAQFTVSCQSGSAEVSRFWYYNPLLGSNFTLGTNFVGSQTRILNFTTGIAGSKIFSFFANATEANSEKDVTIVWINPISPTLNIVSNSTNPYTNFGVRVTVTCSSGSANISNFWYHDPIAEINYTLATNFAGSQVFNLDFKAASSGSRLFEFWANSTVGPLTYRTYTVVWIDPTSVVLGLSTNTTNPYTNYWTQITVTCQSGTANVSRWWYTNPFTLQNITLASDFAGSRSEILNFTSSISGSKTFRFFANSTLGSDAYQFITVVWLDPLPVVLGVSSNTTSPQTNEWAQIVVTCQSGSAPVSRWWYYNPLVAMNITLDQDFVGLETRILNFTTAVAASFKFEFFGNSSLGTSAYLIYTIVWVNPTLPVLSLTINSTSPYTNEWVQIVVTCQSGSSDIDFWWYRNPFTGLNITLGTSFAGSRNAYLNFTTGTAGSRNFLFFANSTSGGLVSKDVIVVWVIPISPALDILSNTTSPYTNFGIELEVSCTAGSANTSYFWIYNPLDGLNHTLATNFAGSQTLLLNYSSAIAGPRTFKLFANSSVGVPSYRSFTIVWITPQPPVLNIVANTTILDINTWAQLTVTCQSGSGEVDHLWYYDPLTLLNITLDTNFIGNRIFYLNFTSPSSSSYNFKFWANSSLQIEVFKSIIVTWVSPQPPTLDLYVNSTSPFTGQYVQITLTCQSGSSSVIQLWYNDSIVNANYTLATNFFGVQIFRLNLTTSSFGSYTFKFWAETGITTITDSITVVWISPIAPSLNIVSNTTILYTNFWVQIRISCQSGSGNVDHFWYQNPISGLNITLAEDYLGIQAFDIPFTRSDAGTYTIKAWANSTLGASIYDELSIVWVMPTPPTTSISANITYLEINQWVLITITCTNGSGFVENLWYYNPMDGENHTLEINFIGTRTYYLTFTNGTAAALEFKTWALSNLGLVSFDSIIVTWFAPTPPTGPDIGLIIGLFAGVVGAIAAVLGSYLLYFKVPKTIRTIRKMKRDILKGKPAKPVEVSPREAISKNTFRRIMKEQKMPTKKLEAPEELKKFKEKVVEKS